MERWQKKVYDMVEREKVISSEIDFTKDEEEIKNAFFNICKPIEELDEVELDKEKMSFSIMGKEYTLCIEKNSIGIQYTRGQYQKKQVFMIDEDRQNFEKNYSYHDSNRQGQYMSLEDLYFNYEDILNELMNEIIKR